MHIYYVYCMFPNSGISMSTLFSSRLLSAFDLVYGWLGWGARVASKWQSMSLQSLQETTGRTAPAYSLRTAVICCCWSDREILWCFFQLDHRSHVACFSWQPLQKLRHIGTLHLNTECSKLMNLTYKDESHISKWQKQNEVSEIARGKNAVLLICFLRSFIGLAAMPHTCGSHASLACFWKH